MRIISLFLLPVIHFLFISSAYGGDKNYIKEEIDNVRVAGTTAKVISHETLVEGGHRQQYSVINLFDGNRQTAWCTRYEADKEKRIVSESGSLRLLFDTPVYVRSITIRNGYQKTPGIYAANQRVKELTIEKVITRERSYPLDDTVRIRDSMKEQEISLTAGWTQSVNLFKAWELIFTIQDFYRGTKYEDLCISELRVNVAKDSSYVPSVKWKKLKKLIDTRSTKRDQGWSWDGLNKINQRLFNDLLYYVLKNNRESYAYFSTYYPEGTGSSEGMTYLYIPAVKDHRRGKRR